MVITSQSKSHRAYLPSHVPVPIVRMPLSHVFLGSVGNDLQKNLAEPSRKAVRLRPAGE